MIDFFEFSNEMLCVANQEGHFTRVNDAWTKTLGWSADELTTRPYLDFVHPDDLDATMREAMLLRSGNHETVWFENRYRCVDGSYRWLAWRVSVVASENQLVCSARDITEQKTQAQALAESEQRFRTLAVQAPVGIFQADVRGQGTFVNQRWCVISGLTVSESLGDGWKQVVHPDDLQRVADRWSSCVQEGGEWNLEFRVVNRNGALRWVSSTSEPIRDTLGVIIGHIGTIKDITDRRLIEEALRESEQRFRQLATRAPIGIAEADAEGSVYYVNDKWCELAGVTQQEAMGFAWKEFLHSDDLPRVYSHWQSYLQAGQDMPPVEFRFLHRNGDIRWASSSSTLLKDALGNVTGQIVSEQDITELKTTEQSLRSEQDLLRNVIEVQEKEKQFVCHEFHDGLIQYAVGSLMLLESCRNASLPQAELTKIETAISNLSRGIEDGRRVIRGIRPSVLDDSGLAAAMEDLIGQFANSGMHVTSQCDADIGRLPNEIETTVYRVVQEALNNAKKYSGTDVVRIDLKKVNGDLHLEVRDFGCGFDVESARKKGFGLMGMTERVRLLGGECLIHSEQDVGTRVFVRLPLPAMSL